ncbi:MAG: hypothetical protein J0I00_11090 [Burkholderiales bacterium]|nr:hypothetical protein [Burkholderiales bacterium]
MSQPSSLSFTSSLDSSLLVCDVAGSYRPAAPAEVLQAALRVLAGQLRGTEMLSSPQAVRDFLRIELGTLEHEVFAVIHLDAQHRVIEYVEMFRGTVSQTSVYPREIVKEALTRNSAALILAHFVARHKMRILCPVFLCAVLGGQERTSWASGQNRGT